MLPEFMAIRHVDKVVALSKQQVSWWFWPFLFVSSCISHAEPVFSPSGVLMDIGLTYFHSNIFNFSGCLQTQYNSAEPSNSLPLLIVPLKDI